MGDEGGLAESERFIRTTLRQGSTPPLKHATEYTGCRCAVAPITLTAPYANFNHVSGTRRWPYSCSPRRHNHQPMKHSHCANTKGAHHTISQAGDFCIPAPTLFLKINTVGQVMAMPSGACNASRRCVARLAPQTAFAAPAGPPAWLVDPPEVTVSSLVLLRRARVSSFQGRHRQASHPPTKKGDGNPTRLARNCGVVGPVDPAFPHP